MRHVDNRKEIRFAVIGAISGQRRPPLDDPTFPGPNDGFNDARFAEWQCKAAENLGRSFSEMPVHCQRAATARDVWKRMHVELPKEEGNAAKLTDGPMDYAGPSSLGTQTFATRLMGKALYSTDKPDDTPGGCDWDKDGEDDCALTVKDPGPPELPEDFVDASVAGGQEDASDVAADGDCHRMVGKLREITAQSINKVGPINDMLAVHRLIVEIDASFFNFFVGQQNFTSTQAQGAPGAYLGATGFKPEFLDSLDPYSDQTHHFAAYFHTGIWETESWKAYAHSLTDILSNDGDYKLGNTAFDLGVSLRTRQIGTQTRMNRNNPRLPFPEKVPIYESYEARKKRVFGIADAVMRQICN